MIPELTAIFIRGRVKSGTDYRTLAADYGVSISTVSRVVSGTASIASPKPDRKCLLPGCRNRVRSRYCCTSHAGLHRAGRIA